MFDKLVHMPTKTYDFATSGELLSKLTYDTEQVAEAATKAITVLVRDGLTVVGLLGLMFYQSFILSIGLAGCILLYKTTTSENKKGIFFLSGFSLIIISLYFIFQMTGMV